MSFVSKVFSLFNKRERVQLGFLAFALVVRAFVELLGVASIAPFMAVVASPEEIEKNVFLQSSYEFFQFENYESFLLFFGVCVIFLLVFCNTYSAIAQWALLKFSWNSNHRLCVRLLENYLLQPYVFYTRVNTSKLNNSILAEVSQVVNGVVIPALTAFSRSLVAVALICLLVYADPFMAIVIVAVLGVAYVGLYLVIRAKQLHLGEQRKQANQDRFRITNEAFGGIKDVKVLGREAAFLSRFYPVSKRFSDATASNAIVSQLPRYLFETLAFGGMVLIVVYYLQAGRNVSSILPKISLYAFAGYRLMPELQQLFHAIATMRFNTSAMEQLVNDLGSLRKESSKSVDEPLSFQRDIEFSSVSFGYEGACEPTIKNLSLVLKKNQTIGIVGESGAGKTTLVDLLLGLYQPCSGFIAVDGVPLDRGRLELWRNCLGYVPQSIFLGDESFAQNIAFGIPVQKIDHDRVSEAARLASLSVFIESLPCGYDTLVGERGVRISGGQRQRIGIARALYHSPDVLVMDEATSALDGATENAVMEAISGLAGKKTIVLIAHRISTVEKCDQIYVLKKGRVVAQGNYKKLVETSEVFRELASLTEVS